MSSSRLTDLSPEDLELFNYARNARIDSRVSRKPRHVPDLNPRAMSQCKCGEDMKPDMCGQYICKCGFMRQIHGDASVDGNHSNIVSFNRCGPNVYHGNGYVAGISAEKDPETEIFKQLQAKNIHMENKFPATAIRHAAHRCAEVYKHSSLRGRNKLGIIEQFIREGLAECGATRDSKEIAKFLGARPKRNIATAQIQSLVDQGKITAVKDEYSDDIYRVSTNQYFELLGLPADGRDFVYEIAKRSESALKQASAAKTKCAGAIYIYVLTNGIEMSAQDIVTALDIKQTTFIGFAQSVVKEQHRFDAIFKKYNVNPSTLAARLSRRARAI